MKVLLVYCNTTFQNAIPMGVSLLIAHLKKAGITVDLFDSTFYKWSDLSGMEQRMNALQFKPCYLRYKESSIYDDLREKVKNYSPDLIGFSMVEPTYYLGMRLLDSIADIVVKNGIKIAVGGVHAIFYPESFFKKDLIDYICIGEGEETFVELCLKLESGKDLFDIGGFIIRKNHELVRNNNIKLVDINQSPILDFDLYGKEFLQKPMMGKLLTSIAVEITRGCPYHCTYCAAPYLARISKNKGSGSWYRIKTIEKLYKEYNEYVRKYNPDFIHKHSESFLSVGKKRLYEYMEMYSEFAIPYWIETRPEDITEEKAKLLAKTNCKRISIGMESGNEKYRINMLKRKQTDENLLRAARLLHNAGISFSVNLIIGLPGETREMIFEGIELLRKMRPDSTSACMFTPYKGSFLRKYCEEKGMISPDYIGDDYSVSYSLKNNTLSEKEVLGFFRTLPLYIELPKSEYKRIEEAEKMTEKGNAAFEELKQSFLELKGW